TTRRCRAALCVRRPTVADITPERARALLEAARPLRVGPVGRHVVDAEDGRPVALVDDPDASALLAAAPDLARAYLAAEERAARAEAEVARLRERLAEARGHLESARERVDAEGADWAFGAAMDALAALGGDVTEAEPTAIRCDAIEG